MCVFYVPAARERPPKWPFWKRHIGTVLVFSSFPFLQVLVCAVFCTGYRKLLCVPSHKQVRKCAKRHCPRHNMRMNNTHSWKLSGLISWHIWCPLPLVIHNHWQWWNEYIGYLSKALWLMISLEVMSVVMGISWDKILLLFTWYPTQISIEIKFLYFDKKKVVVYRGSLWKCWRYIFIIMFCFVFILFSCFSGCCFIKQIWVISSHH